MEMKHVEKNFKCDGWQCDQLGIMKHSPQGTPVTSGTWFRFSTERGGEPLDFCSKKCLCNRIENQGMTPQTILTIRHSFIENVGAKDGS